MKCAVILLVVALVSAKDVGFVEVETPAGLSKCSVEAGTCSRPTANVATFNSALYPLYFPLVNERFGAIVQSLMGANLDALCVQEFWLDSTLYGLAHYLQLAGNLPFLTAPPKQPGKCWCTQQAIYPLVVCAQQCADAPNGMQCLAEKCTAEALALPRVCSACLSTDMQCLLDGSCTFEESVQRCVINSHDPSIHPNTCRSFGGNAGSGLFTKTKPLETDVLFHDAVLFSRTTTYAKVRLDTGVTHLFCSHTTPSNWSHFPEGSNAGSSEQENKNQIADILKFVASKAKITDRVVILGDHNTGPSIPKNDVEGWTPENFGLFKKRGFKDAYTSQKDATCTFCRDNPLQQVVPRENTAIDHILTSIRVADGGVGNTTAEGLQGKGVSAGLYLNEYDVPPYNLPRSDHYGVRGTIEGPPCLLPCKEGTRCVITEPFGVPKCCSSTVGLLNRVMKCY